MSPLSGALLCSTTGAAGNVLRYNVVSVGLPTAAVLAALFVDGHRWVGGRGRGRDSRVSAYIGSGFFIRIRPIALVRLP